jgi:Ankyrin repeats (3 copies)
MLLIWWCGEGKNESRTQTSYLTSRFFRDVYRIIPQGVEMNKKVTFIIAFSILLLVAESHRTYAADTSAELFAAVKSGETAKVGQLLAAGADPNVRRQEGLTPLISAALGGRADIAKLLVDKGADVNAKSDNGMTPLMVAAAEGHKGVAQLLLNKGADANIRNDTSGLTAFKTAALRQHKEVAALLRPHTVDTQDPASALLGMKKHFVITRLYPGLFVTMALFFLVIGLRGIVTKKPFLISARWLLFLILLGFGPGMLQAVSLPTSGDGSGMLMALRWMIPTVLIVVLAFLSFTIKGYIAFGVTDVSFREGVLASLKKLNLDHEETMSILRLPTIGADLQVAVQSWIGTAQIKMKQRQFRRVLVDIVNNMNQYYQNSAVSKMNLTSCIFYVVMGVLLLVFAGVFLLGFGKIL